MVETPPPRRYDVAELKHLAKSPLVKKPDGLPPIEEWMGPLPATRPQNARARTDGDVLAGVSDDRPAGAPTAARRPSFFGGDSRLSRSSIPEDIILGPPKMSFASSSARTPSGKFDNDPFHPLSSPALDDDRLESPRFERFKMTSLRGDKDREPRGFERGDPRGNPFKRTKDEGDGWTNVQRPRKSFGAEDGERFRQEVRSGREKKESPWTRDPRTPRTEKDDDREHRPRTKRDESSWLLDDHRGERGHREHHRFGSRAEKDPEWMDSGADGKVVGGETKAAHSMEEFQRWKERMKANGGSTEPRKKIEELIGKSSEPAEPRRESPRKPSPDEKLGSKMLKDESPKEEESGGVALGGVSLVAAASAVEVTPLPEPDTSAQNGVDKYFSYFSASTSSSIKMPEQDNVPRAEPKIGKSRFTSFFTQPQVASPPVAQQEPPAPSRASPHVPTPPIESTNEDKEGFQRILKMLGGSTISDAAFPPRTSVSPAMRSGISSAHQPPPQFTSPNNPNNMTSPPAAKNPSADADFFMRLMQNHPSHSQPPPPPPQQQSLPSLQNHYNSGPSQMPPPPPIDTGMQPFPRNKPNHPMSPPFDDPAIAVYRQRSMQESSPIFPRGGPMIDQQGPPGWPQQPHPASQPPPSQAHRGIAPPPGLRSQQQQHHQPGPPPPPHFMGAGMGPMGGPPGVNGLPFPLMGGNGSMGGGPIPGNFAPPPPAHLLMNMQNGMHGGPNGLNGMNGGGMNGGGMNGMNGGPPFPPMNGPGPGPQHHGPPPPGGGFPGMPFAHQHHPEALMHGGLAGPPPFGFPGAQQQHEHALKSPPFGHGAAGKKIFRPY